MEFRPSARPIVLDVLVDWLTTKSVESELQKGDAKTATAFFLWTVEALVVSGIFQQQPKKIEDKPVTSVRVGVRLQWRLRLQ